MVASNGLMLVALQVADHFVVVVVAQAAVVLRGVEVAAPVVVDRHGEVEPVAEAVVVVEAQVVAAAVVAAGAVQAVEEVIRMGSPTTINRQIHTVKAKETKHTNTTTQTRTPVDAVVKVAPMTDCQQNTQRPT